MTIIYIVEVITEYDWQSVKPLFLHYDAVLFCNKFKYSKNFFEIVICFI